MKSYRRCATAALCCLGVALAAGLAPPVRAAGLFGPTGDIVERFGADPLTRKDPPEGQDFAWSASGSWAWEPLSTAFSSSGRGPGDLLWKRGRHFTGTLSTRLRLGGNQSRARLLFAFDPATGAHRWLEIGAGNPGRVTLGQTGVVGGSAAGVIQTWRTPVATGAWQTLAVVVAGDKSVTASLGGRKLFTAAVAPLAAGLVGFGVAEGAVSFDEFTFTANPDGEPCRECHAGQADQPLAANVYTWWDGRRWDAQEGTAASAQQGGHGDPGGRAALGCTGATGCHDLRQPQPGDHRNGFREGRGRRTLNAFHLRTEAIVPEPRNPWDAQVWFDVNFCYNLCHVQYAIGKDPITGAMHSHSPDAAPAVNAVQLGTHLTRPLGESLPVPVDSDITTRALATRPDFATCVSCHDPHGTGAPDNGARSNFMLRLEWTTDLCKVCHI